MSPYLNQSPHLSVNHLRPLPFRMRSEALLCLVLLLSWMPQPTHGQTPSSTKASLVVVNALPGPENLHVFMASQELWAAGFTPGQSTGGVIIPAGKPPMEARCPGFASTKFAADFPDRANCAMVFYPGEEVKEGPEKGKKSIGVFFPPFILDGQSPKGKSWEAILVGPLAQASLTFNSQPINLMIGKPVKLTNAGRIEVKSNGTQLLAASPEESGNYWLILFGDSLEKLTAVLLNHIHYDIPKP